MRALASLLALTCALYTRYGFPSGNVFPGLDRASSLCTLSSNSTLTRSTDLPVLLVVCYTGTQEPTGTGGWSQHSACSGVPQPLRARRTARLKACTPHNADSAHTCNAGTPLTPAAGHCWVSARRRSTLCPLDACFCTPYTDYRERTRSSCSQAFMMALTAKT
jgi:hypothetical protein